MIYAHTNMDTVSPCDTKLETKELEVKEVGIYAQTNETRQVLTEILFMLDQFKHEIRNYDVPEGAKNVEPTCFRDEVAYINTLAFAIKGDLSRLMDEFH